MKSGHKAWHEESWWWKVFLLFRERNRRHRRRATPTSPIVGLAIVDSRLGGWCPALGLFSQIVMASADVSYSTKASALGGD